MKQAVLSKLAWREQKPLLQAGSLKRKRIAVSDLLVYTAAIIVLFFLGCAIFPSWIAPYSPTSMVPTDIMKSPSLHHLFGTDYFGRDVFSVVVYGSRDSLIIGVAAAVFGAFAGGLIGAIAGYIGGAIDVIFMRLIDVLMAIPGILLALAVAAALGPSLINIVLAVSISAIPGYARVIRGQIMSIKGRPYITAARSIGTRNVHIFLRHVLPNSLSPLLVMATIGLGTSILVGSGLSFLGLGVIKEVADWGTLLSQGRGYLTVAWWICTFPGLAITLFVLSINLMGDRFRDYIDPKQSRN
ncbi:ABC transporter permease [Cohnella abietis]|uniref:Peptide ABC transporter permease n=1 Tax=Cohnella abietis TaxID=2507935 RepID=A0A3T1DF46_9BACL|nr:ABC transporter permease [Cohnella abietis]BBI36644.1 peptide ABC transporter permease [Cohnella abietis]